MVTLHRVELLLTGFSIVTEDDVIHPVRVVVEGLPEGRWLETLDHARPREEAAVKHGQRSPLPTWNTSDILDHHPITLTFGCSKVSPGMSRGTGD
jgi:hypothetical protein